MKKIDTSKWKEFLIGDLFDIHPTCQRREKNNVKRREEIDANAGIENAGILTAGVCTAG